MYSPTLGRFLQRDPAGYVDGVNLYSYVKNNPLVYLDPEGLTRQDVSYFTPSTSSMEVGYQQPSSPSVFTDCGTQSPISNVSFNASSPESTISFGAPTVVTPAQGETTLWPMGEFGIDSATRPFENPSDNVMLAARGNINLGGPLYDAGESGGAGVGSWGGFSRGTSRSATRGASPGIGAPAAQGTSRWTPFSSQGVKVYQRRDLIDPSKVDALGRSNLQRMQQGLAPIGPDGKPINLHHMLQTADSPVAEVTQTFHQEYRKIIHINPNTVPSGIDREAFDIWRTQYWIERARDFFK